MDADVMEKTATVDPKTAASLAGRLMKRESLDVKAHDEATRLAATLHAIDKAGDALAPSSRSARTVLKALSQLETLATLTVGSLTRPWLALRGLELNKGDAVGGSLVTEPAISTFISLAGAVPTLDTSDKVQGALGTWDPDHVTSRGRIIDPGAFAVRQFTVTVGDRTVFTEPAEGTEPENILEALTRLPSRHQSQATNGKTRAGGPVAPIDYDAVEPKPVDALAGDILFEEYKPQRMVIKGAKAHPTPLVESAALASVAPPAPGYKPTLKTETVTSGVLSDVQLEGIVYAGQAHEQYLSSDPDDPNGTAPRRGFFIGHGMGVGKGRLISGIIMDNWNQGRKRHVWVTERARLLDAARRDWISVGGKAADVFDLRSVGPNEQIPARNGILFVTYAALRGEGDLQSRVEQIVEWLHPTTDGCIVFDETHNLRNALPVEGMFGQKEASKQGQAALEFQRSCPNARVTYVSATGATEIGALGFATRLGLWGRGTPFPTAANFFEQMEIGGLNALELVARDLKSMGLYVCANLSFNDVEYDRLEYRLTDEERELQDKMAKAWARVADGLNKVMNQLGIAARGKVLAGAKNRGMVMAQYANAKQRFFQALLASIKTKPVIDAVQKDLANGHSAVIQMTNTYEATLNRALANSKDPDYGDVDATPRDILLQYVETMFPIWKQRQVRQGNKTVVKMMTDHAGNPVVDTQAVAERDAILAEIRKLSIPEGPMEQLFDVFGPHMIAEVTGRRKRLIPGFGGHRTVEERTARAVDEDIRLFQAGIKRILVFSTSGAAGSDYHADRNATNKALRVHYLLQTGFRSDLVLQGMGRTHRSNQVQPPRYVLVMTDLWADRRILSTIASRMESLGAITRGQRHAASQGFFSSDDNLESPMAQTAWRAFLTDLEQNKIPGMTLAEFEFETGISVRMPNSAQLRSDLPSVTRFLNQMAGMTCDKQELFGTAYKARLEDVRLAAIRDGSYDRGIETIKPDSLIKLEDQIIFREPKTGAVTRLVQLLRRDTITPMTFDEAAKYGANNGAFRFAQSVMTGRVVCVVFPKKGAQLDATTEIAQVMPTGIVKRTAGEIWKERVRVVSYEEARRLWDAEFASMSTDSESFLWVVTGTLLPVWDKLPRDRVTVYRMETDFDERILGRVVPEEYVERLCKRMDALSGGGMDADACLAALEQGEICTLANGWVVQGEPCPRGVNPTTITVTLRGDDGWSYKDQLSNLGLIPTVDVVNNDLDFHLPRDPAARTTAWKALVKDQPVVGITSLYS